jgi:hypothetical protein
MERSNFFAEKAGLFLSSDDHCDQLSDIGIPVSAMVSDLQWLVITDAVDHIARLGSIFPASENACKTM